MDDSSWDYTEPIVSFTTAGVGIIGYIFYMLTRRDYTYEVLNQITLSRRQKRLYERANLDLSEYARLLSRGTQLEHQMQYLTHHFPSATAIEDAGVSVQALPPP